MADEGDIVSAGDATSVRLCRLVCDAYAWSASREDELFLVCMRKGWEPTGLAD